METGVTLFLEENFQRRIERRVSASSADIVSSNDLSAIADVSASSADMVASNDECFMMFHIVLRVFHSVLLVVYDVLCFTMFYAV